MDIGNFAELLANVDSNLTLIAVIAYLIVWFFRKPLENLISAIVPGEHIILASSIIKNMFVFGLLGIVLVALLQAQQQSNEYLIEEKKLEVPLEMKKLDIQAEELYGLTNKTINKLLIEFNQNPINVDTDIESASSAVRALIQQVQKMKSNLTASINANESIRALAIEALNSLESGDLKRFRAIHKTMVKDGLLDPCLNEENRPSQKILPPSPTPIETPFATVVPVTKPKRTNVPTPTTRPIKDKPTKAEVNYEELKRVRFLLATYGDWKIPTGSSTLKVYPSMNIESDMMVLTETECASEISLSNRLDDFGYLYQSQEQLGNCFSRMLNEIGLSGPNVLGLNVDNLTTQYKRIDAVSKSDFNAVVYNDIDLFELPQNKTSERTNLNNIKTAVETPYSPEQLKLLGHLYFVSGLSKAEIQDIPFPKGNIAEAIEEKIQAVQVILLAAPETRDIDRVKAPIVNERRGYQSNEANQFIPKEETASPPLPPSNFGLNAQ